MLCVPGTSLAYACITDGSAVSVIDLDQRRQLQEISVDRSPVGMALSRDGKTLYVGCAGPDSQNAMRTRRRRRK